MTKANTLTINRFWLQQVDQDLEKHHTKILRIKLASKGPFVSNTFAMKEMRIFFFFIISVEVQVSFTLGSLQITNLFLKSFSLELRKESISLGCEVTLSKRSSSADVERLFARRGCCKRN